MLLLVAIAPFLVLVAWHWRYGPLAAFGDWAQYLLHADAIRHGRSYGDIGYIFTSRNPFIGPPVQPPGLPLMLVPFLALTGGAREGVVYKLLMVLFAIVFLAAAWRYLERDRNGWLATAAVMITGLWLEVAYVTNVVQPDVAFSAFLWLIFLLVDGGGRWTWPRVAAVTALGFAALAFRLAALPIFPAALVYALVHRREHGSRPLIPVAIWGACGLVGAALMGPGTLTFARLVPRDPSLLVHNVIEAAKEYPVAIFDLFLYPLPWNHANDAYHLVAALLTVLGAVGWLRTNWSSLLGIFAVFYVAMLAVLPMQDGRYLMPLAPLALFFLARGLSIATAWIAARLRPAVIPAAPRLAWAVCLTISAIALARELRRPKPAVLLDAPGIRTAFSQLAVANRTSPARVAFVNPRVLTWETGIPAMGFFRASPDSTLAEFRAKRITHVVVGDLGTDPSRAASVQAAVAARPAAFRRLFAEGAFTVYAFDSTAAPRP